MVIPDNVPLVIKRGRDFNETFEFEAFNLTGYTARAQIREAFSLSSALVEEFHLTVTPGVNSTIAFYLSETETAAITADTAYYDLLLTSPGGVDDTYIFGQIQIIGSATEKATP